MEKNGTIGFAEPATKREARPTLAEVASVGQDDLYASSYFFPTTFGVGGAVGGILLNPDPVVLHEAGLLDVAIYDEMVDRDNHLAGVLDVRFNAVLSLPRQVVAASDAPEHQRHVDFCRQVFAEMAGWDESLAALMHSVVKGYALGEVIWCLREDGFYGIAEVKDRDQRRFVFDLDWNARLKTRAAPFQGIALPARKFLVARHKPHGGNPYGVGIGRSLWWAFYFKRNALKFWLVFSEKFGMPTVIGKAPKTLSPAEKGLFLETLKSLQKETAIRIDDDLEVSLLEAVRSGNINTYSALVEFLNGEMSKRAIGQTLTTEPGATGSYALGRVHGDVRQDVLESDARLASALGSQLCRWIVEVNFGPQQPGKYPRYEVDATPPDDLKMVAERDSILLKMGVPMGKRATLKRYGLPEVEPNDEPLTAPASPAPVVPGPEPEGFAEPGPRSSRDAALDQIEAAGTATISAEFLALQAMILEEVRRGKARRTRSA